MREEIKERIKDAEIRYHVAFCKDIFSTECCLLSPEERAKKELARKRENIWFRRLFRALKFRVLGCYNVLKYGECKMCEEYYDD